jgi:hypothetical protein
MLAEIKYRNSQERFMLEVKNLIVPMLQTTKEYGLKKRYLQKFHNSIEAFYTYHIDNSRSRDHISMSSHY